MMMMPFVRLLAIYALVGAAIFAFLKRDDLIEYFSTPEVEKVADAAPISPPVPPSSPPAPEEALPTEAPTQEAEPVAEVTYFSAPPAFGSEITPQYFGQAAAAPMAPAAPTGESMVTRWTKAREVFSQGTPAEAALLYEALTDDYPNNADLHGETGNLYYNLGQFGKAAGHYFAVGEIAARKGDMQMAGSMFMLLQRISPSKAAELQALLSANR